MSKRMNTSVLVRITFLILMGLLSLLYYPIAIAVFVPVAGWYLWRMSDRLSQLEAKQGEPSKKSEGT